MIKLKCSDRRRSQPFKVGPDTICKCGYCDCPGMSALVGTAARHTSSAPCGIALLPNWTFRSVAMGAILFACPDCSRRVEAAE